jgi:hypothetical protein
MSITDPLFFELISFFIDVLLAELARSVAIDYPGIFSAVLGAARKGFTPKMNKAGGVNRRP